MEFNEKLQELRKNQGLTQEELAEALWVSRTAVSKWESGRGYPSIDSLKQLARFFHVTIDELLSGDEILSLAEADQQQKTGIFQDTVFGLLDVCAAMFLFLPFFSQQTDGALQAVSLLSLTEIAPYLRCAYFAAATGSILWGILTLALQICRHTFWLRHKRKVSLVISSAGTFLFIISPQPYAAAFLFVLLIIKVLILAKSR